MVEEVIAEIKWTDSATRCFNAIIDYLRKAWTDKDVARIIGETAEMLSALKHYPEMCRPSQKKKHVRIGILNKHTQ